MNFCLYFALITATLIVKGTCIAENKIYNVFLRPYLKGYDILREIFMGFKNVDQGSEEDSVDQTDSNISDEEAKIREPIVNYLSIKSYVTFQIVAHIVVYFIIKLAIALMFIVVGIVYFVPRFLIYKRPFASYPVIGKHLFFYFLFG